VLAAVAKSLDPDRAHPERVTWALVGISVLFFVGLAIGVSVGVRGEDLVELILALVTAALSLLPLVLDQARRPSERHVLLSVFALVFILGFVLPVFVIFIPAQGPEDAPSYSFSALYPVDIIRGQLSTILGLVCLLIGYASPAGRALTAFLPRFRRDWPPPAALAVAILMIPFGWSILLSGLFGLNLASLGSGFYSVFGSSYVYGIALLSIVYARHKSPTALLMLFVVVPITSFFGLFTGSKTAVLIAGAMVVLSIILVQRRIRARWLVLGALTATFIFPVTMFVRADILQQNTLSAADALRNPGATLTRVAAFMTTSKPEEYFMDGLLAVVGRMDCIGAASVLIRDTPGVAPFQNGRTLGLFFVAFIPRAIWPNKPTITIGRYITDVYGSGPEIDSSTAPTQLGELFINFGYPGIIGGMLFYGIALRIAHELLLRGRPTTPALFAAVVIILHLGTGFQGDTANNWAVTLISLVPIIFAHVAVTTLFPTRQRPLAGFEPSSGNPAID
jgi:hypothetical protein